MVCIAKDHLVERQEFPEIGQGYDGLNKFWTFMNIPGTLLKIIMETKILILNVLRLLKGL